MKIKLDENIPLAVAELLRSLGHDVDTVVSEGLTGTDTDTDTDDDHVWQA